MPFWKKDYEEKFEKDVIFQPVVKTEKIIKEYPKYGDISCSRC